LGRGASGLASLKQVSRRHVEANAFANCN